jgi:hypothetical protein
MFTVLSKLRYINLINRVNWVVKNWYSGVKDWRVFFLVIQNIFFH